MAPGTAVACDLVETPGPRSKTVYLHIAVLQLAWFGGLIAAGVWLLG